MIEAIHAFVQGVDPLWQWAAVILVSMIPFIESYFGSVLGILAGVHPLIAVPAAIIGNWISMFIVVLLADKIRHAVMKGRQPKEGGRWQKFIGLMEKYGVALVSIIGQALLPSHFVAMALVTTGVRRPVVIFWQTISIALWGIAFGLLAVFGAELLFG